MKFGFTIYKIDEINEEIAINEFNLFTDRLINIKNFSIFKNDSLFNITEINNNYKQLLQQLNGLASENERNKEKIKLKSSYLQPPNFLLKKDIALVEGKWHFKNLYENYFCFCKGDICLNILIYQKYIYQSCKYYFYLTIIDNNKDLYPKSHYLLSDFFDSNIEPSDAFPIFKEMLKMNFKVHYLTMSLNLYNEFCLNNYKCFFEHQIIYGHRVINGNFLEKYLELVLSLKAVITAEKYESIDNLFYNIEYINYIFLGHGVTYVKSYLYNSYISPKIYNKILYITTIRYNCFSGFTGWLEKRKYHQNWLSQMG